MGAFEYTAVDAGGRETRGVIEGDTPRQVRQLLRERRLLPLTVTEVAEKEASRQQSFTLRRSMGPADLAIVTRLRDMGIEPFLLSSSLVGVLAQRLVRVLDPEHREAYTAAEYECRMLGIDPGQPPTLYRPRADVPGGAGYKGRTGIYELVTIDDELRTMIHDGSGEHELERHARTRGPSIRDDGLKKVLSGVTTLEEVLRVTRAN